MKKIITLFAFVSFLAISGCSSSDDNFQEDFDTIGVVYENNSSNYYNFTLNNEYSVGFNFPQRLVESDVVLVYRFDGVDNSGQPVWQALPETYFFNDGTRDFSFKYVFTRNYVNIYLDGNNRSEISADYRLNQIFRIVIVPADFATSVDTSNYNEVMNSLKLSENQIQKVKL